MKKSEVRKIRLELIIGMIADDERLQNQLRVYLQ